MTPDANDLCVFAVKRGYIESKEIYCNPLYPTYLSLVEKYQHSPYANGILNNHVAVNPKTDCSLLSDSSEVSFVPMAKVAMSFFANHGYDTEGFTINPYMVVNKVFSSYYKHVQFPIVTFDELKREIQL